MYCFLSGSCDGECTGCFYDYDVTCDYCGEVVHFCNSTGLRYGNNYVLCGACEEDTAACCDCGERYAKDEMYEYDALDKDLSRVIFTEYQCPQCFENARAAGYPVEEEDYKLTRKPKEG